MGRVEDLRQEIDRIDRRIVRLLHRRASAAVRIGDEKRKNGSPIQDPAREREVLRRVASAGGGTLSAAAVRRIYLVVMRACTGVQKATCRGVRPAKRGAGRREA
jgi:chorismate mutase/prephenate dehydratase